MTLCMAGQNFTLFLRFMLNELEKAYLAGFFDGEGSIVISKDTLSISIAQVDKELLNQLYFIYGGSLILRRHSIKNPKWNDAWQWTLKTKKARQRYSRI